MKQPLAILVRGSSPAELSLTPLLGKTSRSHVEAALAESGLNTAPDEISEIAALQELLADESRIVLLVSDDAPCLSGDTYKQLTEQAEQNERPTALLDHDMATPLAIALSSELFEKLLDGESGKFGLQRLIERLDDLETPLKLLPQESAAANIAITDATGFAGAYRYMRARIVRKHMENGVILLDPERTIIECDVRIGAGTILYAGNMLQGATVIGSRCTLYPNNRILDAEIGDETTVESSVLLHCKVGGHTTVGPYAYLRPDASIGDHCRIGDFVEIKNSTIDDGTKVSHLTYVGDSDLGKDINLGCGVVFVNYDGKTKNRSKVEDHAFIGCNCNLVAPVHIGKNAYLAAGSTVVENIPDDALFVARSRGVIKEDWVKHRKEQGKL